MTTLKRFRQMSGLPDSIRRWSDAAEQVKAGQKALAEQALVSKRSLEPRRAPPPNIAWLPGFEMSAVNLRSMGEWERADDNHWRTVEEQTIPHEAGLFRSRVYLTNENYAAMQDGSAELAQGLTPSNSEAPMDFTVDWRAVASNAPSKTMPRSVPWVHGLIQEAKGPSPRIELAPKRRKGDHYPVHLIMAHPDQAAADAMDWDASVDVTVDGHTVSAQKSMGPAWGWCEPEPIALVAEIAADHPLVIHAAEAAKGPQAAMEQAQDDFYARAREWGDANFPHPDFMNVVRSLMLSEWQHAPGYWPGDPLPDVKAICAKARDQIRA